MTTIVTAGEASAALADLSAALSAYAERVEFRRRNDADLVAELRGLENIRRRLHALDHPLVAELDNRGIGVRCGARSTPGLLQATLRLSPREARARARAAAALGPRTALTGESLLPQLGATATSAAAGRLSDEHVARMIDVVEELPADLPVQERDAVDKILVGVAEAGTPRDVAAAGIRLLDTINPDGGEPDDERHERGRRLSLCHRRDGSYQLTARLSPECGIQAEAVLSSYASPRPTVHSESGIPVPDQRSPAQRRHDALHDLTSLALHSDTLQHTGHRAELIITATADIVTTNIASANIEGANIATADIATADIATADIVSGAVVTTDAITAAHAASNQNWRSVNEGLRQLQLRLRHRAHTMTGSPLSSSTAARLCDISMVATVHVAADGRILNYGQTRRFASKPQLRALIARDRGCSFPGCDHPPQWCDVHHIVEWINGGYTDLENLTLVCGYHHRGFARMGWTCHIDKGVPYWKPPFHVDPDRAPQRNLAHLLR